MRFAPKLCLVCCSIGALVAAPAYGGDGALPVTVHAVGPASALAGDTVTIDFIMTADEAFLMRGYVVTPPCALEPQEGSTGTVDTAVIFVDGGRGDWVMCGAPCNCGCASVPVLDAGNCQAPCPGGDVDCPDNLSFLCEVDEDCGKEKEDVCTDGLCQDFPQTCGGDARCEPSRNPRVGWATIFTSDSADTTTGPRYLAEATYIISGDASGGFNFEFQDVETPEGGSGSTLRDIGGNQVFADWIGTKVLIVACVEDSDCDDGIACTNDSCVNDACVNAPDDGACDDGNDCTDDRCDPASGCVSTNASDGSPCDDGSDTDCDNPDTCSGGVCQDNNEPDGPAPGGCNDGNDCTQDNCSGGACANPNEANGTACGSGSDTDCDNPDSCDGNGNCNGNNAPNGTSCPDDGNDCTDDECSSGSCVHPNNNDPCDDGVGCNGADNCSGGGCNGHAGDPCAGGDECDDDCHELGGGAFDCSDDPGTACTDDGEICTDDVCSGTGDCIHPDIPACEVPVCLEAGIGADRTHAGCVALGETVVIKVVLGATSGLVGAQFRVEYDANSLELKGFGPGTDCDPGAEFNTLLNSEEGVDDDGHAFVFMAVATGGTGPECTTNDDCGEGGVCLPNGHCLNAGDTSDGGTAGCLFFNQLGGCENSDVCFCEDRHDKEFCNPHLIRLVNDQGGQIPTQQCQDGACTDVSPETPIEVNQPCGNGACVANADCERPTAIFHWDPPKATDECGELEMVCDCTGTQAQCDDWLANSGGEFPQGEWLFWCEITDVSKCPESIEIHWSVSVSDQSSLDLELQLSPEFVDEEVIRGITFELYEACSPFEIISETCQDIAFGGPFHFGGHFAGEIKVPKGQYICISARDTLHTLRSSADLSCDSAGDGGTGHFSAIFKGQPPQGNWLIAGNLDGNRTNETGSPHTIDIIDYGIFVNNFLTAYPSGDTPCDSKDGWDAVGGHADINGDGLVDDIDFTFIAINFLETDKDVCCPDRSGDEYPAGLTEISIRDLYKMGLGHLASGDLNGDGMLDMDDMQAFMAGERPKRPGSER